MIAALGTLSLLSRIGIAAAIVIVSIGGIAAYNESQKRKGEARVIERSKMQGKVNERKASQAHERARTPGAAERLLRDSCRDC